MKRLFKQFSFPGGIPSHVAPETPGSIHEGGELGYSLSHAYGAAFDNPDLLVACVDRRRRSRNRPARDELALEQVPQSGDRRRRAADPSPERLQDCQPDGAGADRPRRARPAAARLRLPPYFVEGDDPRTMHQSHGGGARRHRRRDPAYPDRRRAKCGCDRRGRVADARAAIPEGLDGTEGSRRQEDRGVLALAPGADGRAAREPRARSHARRLDEELPARGAVRFHAGGCVRSLPTLAPKGERRMGANPHANGGLLLEDLRLPDFTRLRGRRAESRRRRCRGHASHGAVPPRRR